MPMTYVCVHISCFSFNTVKPISTIFSVYISKECVVEYS